MKPVFFTGILWMLFGCFYLFLSIIGVEINLNSLLFLALATARYRAVAGQGVLKINQMILNIYKKMIFLFKILITKLLNNKFIIFITFNYDIKNFIVNNKIKYTNKCFLTFTLFFMKLYFIIKSKHLFSLLKSLVYKIDNILINLFNLLISLLDLFNLRPIPIYNEDISYNEDQIENKNEVTQNKILKMDNNNQNNQNNNNQNNQNNNDQNNQNNNEPIDPNVNNPGRRQIIEQLLSLMRFYPRDGQSYSNVVRPTPTENQYVENRLRREQNNQNNNNPNNQNNQNGDGGDFGGE